MTHSTALASFSSWEYQLSVSVNALERYVTGLHRLARGSYCFMVAAIPPEPASVFSLVLRCGSKYAITVSPLSIALTCSNDCWHSSVHWNLTSSLIRSRSGAVTWENPSIRFALAPAKNRKERTSTADWGGPAAFRASTLSCSGEMPSLENTFPKNLTARRLSLLFFKLSVSPCSRRSCNTCLSALSCPSGVALKTRMSS